MASSEILSQTLFGITNVKLDQLDKQKAAYESGKRALLEDAALETDHHKRAKLLVEKAVKLPTMKPMTDSSLVSVNNLKRFVEQAQYDPCITGSFIQEYENSMRHELDVESSKYRYAELYGKLVNEWIAAGKSVESDAEAGFGPVGREEMHEQRATWEQYVFHAKKTNADAIKEYLERLFCESSKDVNRAFVDMKKEVETFQKDWDERTHFDEESLADTIRNILRGDSLTDQKRAILGDFLNNKVVLREIADVLNMRMQTRNTWAWDGAVQVEQRRQLNGRYRFHPDEDLLQTIYINHIGTQWGVEIRRLLFSFLGRPGVEKGASRPMTKQELRRRRFFLSGSASMNETENSVEQKLAEHYKKEILLDQLPQSATEKRGGYGSSFSLAAVADAAEDSRKSHIAVVQNLMHLVQSEIIIHQRLGEDISVIRSDFKWFGPSVPHSSIFAVLEFFGVNADWIDLFRRILECPFRFKQDPPDTPAQTRKRGKPLSTPLADFFAETMLFCMDFAVNQNGDGCRLYRLHDDMWLWGGVETCARAWGTMTEFAELAGLDFNDDKTGSVRIGAETTATTADDGLPRGEVTWGFLKLDRSSGRFLLDQVKMDTHIDELRLQLEACNSVFDWIQAWNIYGARFFKTNCGQLANCYSRAHVDSMLAAFQRIQQRLFGDGGAGEHLKRLISNKFGIPDIPDGYLYYPVSLGGLGLKNPFIQLYLIRDAVTEDPNKMVDEFLEEEEAEYRTLKAKFEDVDLDGSMRPSPWLAGDRMEDLKNEPFMGFEEFTRHRRRTSAAMGRLLDRLRELPAAKEIEQSSDVNSALRSMPADWYRLSGYDQWVCELYARDMIARFGSLVIVDRGVLPTGLLDMLRQSRFKWRG